MNKIITLVLGDWSHDGHGQTDKFMYRTNFTSGEVLAAREKAIDLLAEKHGKWIRKALNKLCSEYEDSSFPAKLRNALIESGFKFEDYDSDVFGGTYEKDDSGNWIHLVSPDDDGNLDSEGFAQLYLDIVAFGDPTFQYEEIEGDEIDIDGYGLF